MPLTSQANQAMQAKIESCREILRQLGSVVIAFSGGVDSSFLLALAAETLGKDKVLAAMAVSTIFPQRERKCGQRIAKQIGVELIECATPQLTDSGFTSNPSDKCYYCQTTLLSHLKQTARERGFAAVVTGSNADDVNDYRPGSKAEEQMGIRCPLTEAGLTKDDIRAAFQAMNLPTWDASSGTCLDTRIPYGEKITKDKLTRVARAEEILRQMGFTELRVRDHDSIARIEVSTGQIAMAVGIRDRIVSAFKELGYSYVTIDLQGFHNGAMNETLEKDLYVGQKSGI